MKLPLYCLSTLNLSLSGLCDYCFLRSFHFSKETVLLRSSSLVGVEQKNYAIKVDVKLEPVCVYLK